MLLLMRSATSSPAEDGREQSFNTRAGGLAGFIGIIVSISTAAGNVALDNDPSCLATILGVWLSEWR
jgi:hypothetical protein